MAKLSLRTEPTAPVPGTFAAKAPPKPNAAFVTAPSVKKKNRPITIGSPISAKGRAVFTRQLATLVKAGMPIMRSLEVLARQEKKVAFKVVIEDCADSIRSGGNFSDGLAAHPKAFDRLYINMIKAGEAGGVLATVLERLAMFIEKSVKIRGKIIAAMVYPTIISMVAGSIMAVLLVFVVPKFQDTFTNQLKGKPLPWLTDVVVGFANALSHNILAVLGCVAGAAFLFWLFQRSRIGTKIIHWLLLHAPVVGDLFLKAAIGRFTRTFGTLLSSGVPILQALIITRDTSGNVYIANAINIVHDRVKEGDNVAKPLESTNIFPGMVTSMIEVGEETGALPDMLTRIADTYDEEVDNAVGALTSVIEPIMIVFMAIGVGIIVIAMFLPIVEMMRSMT
jgi:type IV pilus assembly protein PilC